MNLISHFMCIYQYTVYLQNKQNVRRLILSIMSEGSSANIYWLKSNQGVFQCLLYGVCEQKLEWKVKSDFSVANSTVRFKAERMSLVTEHQEKQTAAVIMLIPQFVRACRREVTEIILCLWKTFYFKYNYMWTYFEMLLVNVLYQWWGFWSVEHCSKGFTIQCCAINTHSLITSFISMPCCPALVSTPGKKKGQAKPAVTTGLSVAFTRESTTMCIAACQLLEQCSTTLILHQN